MSLQNYDFTELGIDRIYCDDKIVTTEFIVTIELGIDRIYSELTESLNTYLSDGVGVTKVNHIKAVITKTKTSCNKIYINDSDELFHKQSF